MWQRPACLITVAGALGCANLVAMPVVSSCATTCRTTLSSMEIRDFKEGVIDVARDAHAQIFVDRLGDADTAEAWQKAIDQGAAGIQTNLPAELRHYQLSR